MATNETALEVRAGQDRRTVLSVVWACLLFSFVYADIFTLFFDRTASTQTMDLSSGSILFFAVVMESAIAMVLLSRVLPYVWNRRTNIALAVLHIGVLVYSLTEGTVTSFYAFFAALEIAALMFVIGYAWTWRKQPIAEPTAVEATA
jgi:hypothetical protein